MGAVEACGCGNASWPCLMAAAHMGSWACTALGSWHQPQVSNAFSKPGSMPGILQLIAERGDEGCRGVGLSICVLPMPHGGGAHGVLGLLSFGVMTCALFLQITARARNHNGDIIVNQGEVRGVLWGPLGLGIR